MRFCGKIGYAVTEEVKPGVWSDNIVEQDAVGDYVKNSYRYSQSSNVNDNINITATISIIASPYAMQNYNLIKYVKTIEGISWKVNSIEVEYPRLILTLGGEYNAQ